MKTQTGIWLDSTKAIIIQLSEETEKIKEIHSKVESRVRYEGDNKGYHRLSSQPINTTERKKHQLTDYFHQIMEYLQQTDELLIFGPAETKNGLKKELEQHTAFANITTTVQSCNKLTERQTIAYVKDFFQQP